MISKYQELWSDLAEDLELSIGYPAYAYLPKTDIRIDAEVRILHFGSIHGLYLVPDKKEYEAYESRFLDVGIAICDQADFPQGRLHNRDYLKEKLKDWKWEGNNQDVPSWIAENKIIAKRNRWYQMVFDVYHSEFSSVSDCAVSVLKTLQRELKNTNVYSQWIEATVDHKFKELMNYNELLIALKLPCNLEWGNLHFVDGNTSPLVHGNFDYWIPIRRSEASIRLIEGLEVHLFTARQHIRDLIREIFPKVRFIEGNFEDLEPFD